MFTRLRLPGVAALCCANSFAQSLPVASRPEDVGFSSQRLERTRGALKADVDTGRLPGVVLLIGRQGKVVFYDSAGFQACEFWEDSVSTDVLGRVVEVASAMDLDSFVRERITGPLKMNDTGFWVKPPAVSRLAKPDGEPNAAFADATQKPAVFSGGGGMLSTALDYARFCQMLLNGGELEGVRILAPKTIALMTSDQLPASTDRHTPVAMSLGAFGPVPEMGTSFGLGFAVRVDAGRNPLPGSPGDFSWGGITGTLFWVDPQT